VPEICWIHAGEKQSARWCCTAQTPPPEQVVTADDRMRADTAYRLASKGTALLWRGDFHNARQLLRAMARRADRMSPRPGSTVAETFIRYRRARQHRARILNMLLVPLDRAYRIPLRRAPEARGACAQVYGRSDGAAVVPLPELLGVISASEWRRTGVYVPALGARIHPHYSVFSPVRSEYVDLVARAPLPARECAFDIGTGTGVLSAVLARRGVARLVGTDQNPRAVECANDNLRRLGYGRQVSLLLADLFPVGRAPLIVCNPPWVPGQPASLLDQAVYDPDSRMLSGFLAGLAAHLEPGGEGWLVLSDLAEHLGLRTRAELLAGIEHAGLRVLGRLESRPRHRRSLDSTDPLHAARAAETTSLWRLGVR
jgi:methylase of polypeptide subunit release factors